MKSYRLGVGLLVMNNDGLIWMGKRKRARNNVLQMPQGGIDPRFEADGIQYWETPFEAAKRELFEETGIYRNIAWRGVTTWLCYNFPPGAAKRSYNGQYIGQRQRWFLAHYYGTDDDIHIGDEFASWKWVPRNQVIDVSIDFKQALYAKVFSLLLN